MSNLKSELGLVKYGELKNKFEELGIPSVWKQGKKKVDMINEAIEILSTMDDSKVEDSKEAIEIIVEKTSKELDEKEIKFNSDVEAVVAKKKFYTIDSASKKARQYNNIFLQHRGSAKGIEALYNHDVIVEAIKRMF
tara:strand:+ start:70 stop:480 length:411 start_codon:yes stop_codon:yes gene_type:complete